uniref:Wall-associated receptor kinase galacturonan-binding domain-containing protein n=1 Tax=Acrobeloides nanus TaxID=290746 RepID=A0A914DTQ5_9BILA
MPTVVHEPIIVPGSSSTTTTTTTMAPTTTTIPLICLNPLLQMIHRFVCNPPPSPSNVDHAYTISQQSIYTTSPFNCMEEDLCGGTPPGYPDCTNPAIRAGYLIQPGQQAICPDLIQVVSFKDTSFPANSDVLLAFGQAEINFYRANPATYVELENMGYCSTTFCYCGANVPLYVLIGNLASGKKDHFYTTSLDEAIAGIPTSVYGGTFMGIKCYIWNFNAVSFCGLSCVG